MKKIDWLDNIALKEEDFNIKDKVAFIKDFIFSESLNLIYSPPKQGKTWLGYGLSLFLAKRDDIEQVIYMDMDNSLSTLKERGVHNSLIKEEKISYITRAKISLEPIELLEAVAKKAKVGEYANVVFFIDTTKDFIDTDSKSKATEFLDYCVKIRDASGTVIILHHATKNGRNISGSSVFINTPDNVFEMKQNGKIDNSINFSLGVTHARGLVKDTKWSVNTQTLELKIYDTAIDNLNKVDRLFVEKAILALKEVEKDGLSRSKLIEAMGFKRTDRAGIKIVNDYIGSFWEEKIINSKLKKYFLMEGR